MVRPLILTRAQARQLDALALEMGIPGLILMENAGAGAARVILGLLERGAAREPVGLLCGGGNNGGDAYVAARHLHGAGVEVRLWEWSSAAQLPPDAAHNARCLEHTGVVRRPLRRGPEEGGEKASEQALVAGFQECGLLVDGLLGTGFSGEMRPAMAAVLGAAGESGVPILALDLPSGLDAESAQASAATPRASWTVTFAALKPALTGLSPLTGVVSCVPLGLPPEVFQALNRHQGPL
ncbi:MAG: NAD(P)H-hydrate epimerase [Planctomycetes bacterium]|jgi:NAD(P)H-hydrate epimerase|nr:NAD(P)H-hydrate epimerase [Planctomycetota bacterium]HJO27663.1 NAD(P)H-hydrate epimerase [Planctomycetota bacterium]